MNNELLLEVLKAFSETPLTDCDQNEDPYCRFCNSFWSGNGDDPIDQVRHEDHCLVLKARALCASMKEEV